MATLVPRDTTVIAAERGRMKLAIFLAAAISVFAQPRMPVFEREVLPNGAVLYLCSKPDSTLLTVRVVIRGGAESDPPQHAGVASLVAQALTRGTKLDPANSLSVSWRRWGLRSRPPLTGSRLPSCWRRSLKTPGRPLPYWRTQYCVRRSMIRR